MADDKQGSATGGVTPSSKSSYSSSRTQTLRAIAQSHLTTIEAEDAAETQRQATAQQDLQRYTKVRRKDRPKARSTSPPATTTDITNAAITKLSPSQDPYHSTVLESNPTQKKPKFRPAQDVLSRLQHDPIFRTHLSQYHIGYLERFEGIKEMPVQNWINESTDEEWIPMHRVKYVVRMSNLEREVVWDRDRRIDLIFGSGQLYRNENDEEDTKRGKRRDVEEEEEQSEAGGVTV